jgi:molecular chaperone GrpE (heat shock protein)
MIKKLLNRIRPAPTSQTSPAPHPADTHQTDDLANESQVQALRIELDARDQRIQRLMQEIERLRERQEQLAAETAAARLEALFSEVAGPASQILTQADLLENQGKPVQARDMLAITRRMVRAFERHGLAFEGQVGDQVAFDPSRHTPINTGAVPQPGQPVTIRFTGVTFQGKILYKAVVE